MTAVPTSTSNGFVCAAAIRALTMDCPACGARYEIKACDRRSRVFDREEQRSRCPRCRFTAPVYVIVDVGVRVEEERVPAAQWASADCRGRCHPVQGCGTVALGNGAVPLALGWHFDGTGTRSR